MEDLIENKNLLEMLEFETQIFLDIVHNDGLIVTAKGLTMEVVLMNLLKVYCDPGNLVLVINSSDHEEKFIKEKLVDDNIHSTTFTTNIAEREELYLSGGVHFITTRILVVDMLKNRIPIDKITGIVVLRAHTILESCQEAFVLRLYRQQNKTGFIKAFSNSAQSFTIGFSNVERIMRTLFVKELYLWPRFHSTVIRSLKQHEPQVIELHIPIPEIMKSLQTCLLDLMNLTVKEIKRLNKTVELQEIAVENCLTKKFHKLLQSQLDCIWHQLSSKTKQLISELKALRHLIVLLFYGDVISFYLNLQTYRSIEYAQSSFWVLTQPAEQLFQQANNLIFTKDKEFNPQFCPKWEALSELLKVEIPNVVKDKPEEVGNKVLILCQDKRTCHQLNEFLTRGPHHYLFFAALQHGLKFNKVKKSFEKCETVKEKLSQVASSSKDAPKRAKLEETEEDKEEELKNSYVLTLSQSVLEETSKDELTFTTFDDIDISQILNTTKTANSPTIFIQTFKNGDDTLSLRKALDEIQPSFVIMYHCEMAAVRQIEIYEARRGSSAALKVYFLLHVETVEEQTYLTSLRREKEAFEYLIERKSSMVIPEDQDGKTDQCLQLQRESQQVEENTRQGGRVATVPERQFVIVDMREFRSELPALIHKRNIELEPLTITVGDYILTKDICVERKSISDLIGSLKSGRLYQQCTQMFRHYAKPMLLIEFDQNRQFNWQNNYIMSSDESSFAIQQKILLLTLHFPKLKIIWSPSPYATAQLFEELKQGKEQPDVQHAIRIGEFDLDLVEAKYNSGIHDFVQKLPGIHSKNIDTFLRRCKNLDHALTLTETELKEILGNSSDASLLYAALHNQHQVTKAEGKSENFRKTRSKFQHMRNRKT